MAPHINPYNLTVVKEIKFIYSGSKFCWKCGQEIWAMKRKTGD